MIVWIIASLLMFIYAAYQIGYIEGEEKSYKDIYNPNKETA